MRCRLSATNRPKPIFAVAFSFWGHMTFGTPLLLSGNMSGTPLSRNMSGTPLSRNMSGTPLSRLNMQHDSAETYQECVLQEVIDRWPNILPITDFYPNVEGLCSLGTEIDRKSTRLNSSH